MGETADTAETAGPCETVHLAPAAVLVRHGRICTTLGHYRTNFVQQNPLGFGYVPVRSVVLFWFEFRVLVLVTRHLVRTAFDGRPFRCPLGRAPAGCRDAHWCVPPCRTFIQNPLGFGYVPV
eukprot:1960583-Prymnesium_polylepis.3